MGLLQRCLLLVTLAVVFFNLACETKHLETDADEDLKNQVQDKTDTTQTAYCTYYYNGRRYYYRHGSYLLRVITNGCSRYYCSYRCINGRWTYVGCCRQTICKDQVRIPDEVGGDVPLREEVVGDVPLREEGKDCTNPDGKHLESKDLGNGTSIICIDGTWY